MSKPVMNVMVRSMLGGRAKVRAVFDTGSHFSIIQKSKLPARTTVLGYARPERLKTAARGGRLEIIGTTVLYIQIGKRVVRHEALISPDLSQEMVIGAGTMQEWDISVRNGGGRTRVTVGRDVRDPEVTEVD